MDQSIQRVQSGLTIHDKISLTASERILAVELDLTAQNSKSQPESNLVAEFSRKFSKEPTEAIQYAFRAWRDASPYFPAVSDILELLRTWHRMQAEEDRHRQQVEDNKRIADARARGELVDFSEILTKLNEAIGKIPEAPHVQRVRRMRERVAMQIVPPVHLTKEQIEARREKELAEIREAEEA